MSRELGIMKDTKYRLKELGYDENVLAECDLVIKALERLEEIDNAEPSEALECLLRIYTFSEDVIYQFEKEYNTIKNALLKQQEKEKEKLLFKNIHNTKVKTPLVSIFEGLSKDERFKFIEHIYYHWEEMKEVLEDKNSKLEKENARYKQLEEQIGCPLECVVAVFKAMKQDHIYCDIGNGMYTLHNFRLDYVDLADGVYFTRREYHYVLDDDCCIFVKDYKKTWWLKEDKSE